MPLERQTAFGWLPTADIFLGGVGGGLFLVSFFLHFMNIQRSLTSTGVLLGPILVLAGVLFLAADLGNKSKFYRLFLKSSSWISRGSWILTAFIIFSLVYSFSIFIPVAWPPIIISLVGILAAICSVLVITYPGFLFGVMKGIPFWNTPALPMLFFLSSLYSGTAILLILAPFFKGIPGQEMIFTVQILFITEIILIIIQLLALLSLVGIARNGDVSVKESLRLLQTPLYITLVLIAGMVIPLGLLFFGLGTINASYVPSIAIVSGALVLVGGVFLRYGIVKAGVYLPLRSI